LSSTILQINKLSKKYKDVLALDRLSLKVKKGTVFLLLGPNGSGKTTTLGISLGVLRQPAGSYSSPPEASYFGNCRNALHCFNQPVKTMVAAIYIGVFVFVTNLILKKRDL